MTVNINICGGRRALVRRRFVCPVCKKLARITQSHTGLWYGDIFTCCACGDTWSDGELWRRPFRRGWRREAKRKARADWASPTMTRAELRALRAELEYMDGAA